MQFFIALGNDQCEGVTLIKYILSVFLFSQQLDVQLDAGKARPT